MAKNNYDDKPWYYAAENWTNSEDEEIISNAFHDARFRKAWNDYVTYLEKGKLPRDARKRDIEKIIGRKLSKSLYEKSAA